MSIETYKFPSGLTVMAEEIPSAYTTDVNIVVNVGSLDEADEEAGISHSIEHITLEDISTPNTRSNTAIRQLPASALQAWSLRAL